MFQTDVPAAASVTPAGSRAWGTVRTLPTNPTGSQPNITLIADTAAAIARYSRQQLIADEMAARARVEKPPVVMTRYEAERSARSNEIRGGELATERLAAEYIARTEANPLHDSIIKQAEAIAAQAEQCSQSNTTIAGDVELARIALGLKQSNQFRVWLVCLQIVRETNQNRILRADLEAALPTYGITVSERNLRRWLRQGHGLFWNITDKYLYFAGYNTLSERFTRIASDLKPDLISTNQPGRMRSMYIDVAGSLAQFEANVYAAWLAARNNPTIARSTLSALFDRMPKILRQWEKLAGIKVVTNEGQYHPDHIADVPDHARLYRAGTGNGHSEDHWRARMVNTYHAPQVRQHPKRGQGRRVFHAVRELLKPEESAGNCEQVQTLEGSTGGLKPTGRLYFSDSKHAQRSVKHTGKTRTRFVELGSEDRNTYLWDYAPDGRQRTRHNERVSFDTQCHFHPVPVYAKDVLHG